MAATQVAALLACVDVVLLSQWAETLEPGAVAGVIAGMACVGSLGGIVGAVFGLTRPDRRRGCACGLLFGFISTVLIAMVVFAPAHPVRALIASVLVVATGMAVRWNTP
jgi:hypothetical protein